MIEKGKAGYVSTHSRPKAAAIHTSESRGSKQFQHTAARRRLSYYTNLIHKTQNVSTHSRPKAAVEMAAATRGGDIVSTHSRPKAAEPSKQLLKPQYPVSTHSRPKAAGNRKDINGMKPSFNTQPPEGGWPILKRPKSSDCSFNTQPPEGGCFRHLIAFDSPCMFQHTAARRWLLIGGEQNKTPNPFQHTAARRRLIQEEAGWRVECRVSTHSRPKAAVIWELGFWVSRGFQHTAARRRLDGGMQGGGSNGGFNTQPPEGGCKP